MSLVTPRYRRAGQLAIALSIGGAAAIGAWLPQVIRWRGEDLVAFLLLALGTSLGEWFPVRLLHRSEQQLFTVTDALWVAALLLAPPSVLVLSVAGGVGVTNILQGRGCIKALFNVGQFSIGITLAEVIYRSIGPGSPAEPTGWAAAAVAMSAYLVVSAVLVTLVISITERRPFRESMRQSHPLTLVNAAGNVSLGIAGAALWSLSKPGIAVMAIPLLLVLLAYRASVAPMNQRAVPTGH